MIIDFHTHIFPDSIAEKTVSSLAEKSGNTPYGDGSLAKTIESMKNNCIDYSVTLPVVTKPSQFNSILKFAIKCNEYENLIAFGGIHPDDTEFETHLMQIKESGLKGVKLHPDYQGTFIDDSKYINIIKTCIDLDLIVVIHAGFDEGFPETVHCTPERALNMIKQVYNDKKPDKYHIVLAHGGGNRMFDEVEKFICCQPVYLDLSYILSYISIDQLLRIINKHGINNILFATDFPWSNPAEDISFLKSLPLSEEEKEYIFSKNALKALKMSQT